MPTAQSYTANLPDVKLPSPDGVGARWSSDDNLTTGKSWGEQFIRGLTGLDSEQRYQNALTENNRAYEQALLRESREYDEFLRKNTEMREDNATQRLVADIKAAGLNPWLALQSGGVTGSTAQSGTNTTYSKPGAGSSAKASSSNKSSLSSLAMLLIATARLVAVL